MNIYYVISNYASLIVGIQLNNDNDPRLLGHCMHFYQVHPQRDEPAVSTEVFLRTNSHSIHII